MADDALLYHEKQVTFRSGLTQAAVTACMMRTSSMQCFATCTDDSSTGFDWVQEGSLCGVHCINTLLQGPFFGPVEMSQVNCGPQL